MLPSDRFRSGLGSFLLAHGCYLFTLTSDSPAATPLMPFVLSDSLLAWNRFRKPLPAAQALIHGTYFPAQWLIAVSTYVIGPIG